MSGDMAYKNMLFDSPFSYQEIKKTPYLIRYGVRILKSESQKICDQLCFAGATGANCGEGAAGTDCSEGAIICELGMMVSVTTGPQELQAGSATTMCETGAHLFLCLLNKPWNRPPLGRDWPQMPQGLQLLTGSL